MAFYNAGQDNNKQLPVGEWTATITHGKEAFESVKDAEKLKKSGFTALEIAEADGEIMIARHTYTIELKGENGDEATGTHTVYFQPSLGWKIDQMRAAFGDEVEKKEAVEITPDHFNGRTARCVVAEKVGKTGKTFTDVKWLPLEGEPF